jgi:hypothetical protein
MTLSALLWRCVFGISWMINRLCQPSFILVGLIAFAFAVFPATRVLSGAFATVALLLFYVYMRRRVVREMASSPRS